MTQYRQVKKRLLEFNRLFLALQEPQREDALLILRSLDFAQSIIQPKGNRPPQEPPANFSV